MLQKALILGFCDPYEHSFQGELELICYLSRFLPRFFSGNFSFKIPEVK